MTPEEKVKKESDRIRARKLKSSSSYINEGKAHQMSRKVSLTELQTKFVRLVAEDQMNQTAAARLAGFKDYDKAGMQLMRMPKIQEAIAERREKYAKASNMTRKKVIDGFLEAVQTARTKADAIAMVAAWREIGKICGFYAPTKTELQVSIQGQLLVQKMNEMSDAELVKLLEEGPQIIEGESVVVNDDK